MGLFDIAGKVLTTTAKVGVGVAGMMAKSVMDKAHRADEVRHSSGHLSDDELIRRSKSSSYSDAERAGYRAAYRDRYSDDFDD